MSSTDSGFFDELKRRNIFRVVVVYVVVSWLLLQVGDVLFPALGLPEWSIRLLFALLLLGLPLVVGFSWAFEITPEGLKREKDVQRSESTTGATGDKLNKLTLAALAAAVVFFAVDRLVLGSAEPPPVAADIEVTEDGPSIAVLPFADMSETGDQEWFSDGISEELLNLLAKIPELRVIARTSSFQFKGQNLDLRTIADTLGVAHVLEGSVRRAGDQLRITAQLIDASDGSHLWSDSYDRTDDDIFQVQDEIAAAVVQELRVTLLGETLNRSTTENTEAYDLFLRGQYFRDRGSPDDLARAVDYLEQSIALDSTYAPAWAELSVAYGNMILTGALTADSGVALQEQVIARTLDLDPVNPRTQSRLALTLAMNEWKWAEADAAVERALSAAPGDAVVTSNAALVRLMLGRREEGVRLARAASLADPLNNRAHGNLGYAAYQAGVLDEAKAAYRRSLELVSDNPYGRHWLALVLLAAGDPEAALEELRPQLTDRWGIAALPVVYHALGRSDESDAALADLVERFGDANAMAIAGAHAYRGEIDEAFEWLDRAFVQRDPLLPWVKGDPLLKNLESDPRHRAFLEKMDLPVE